MITKTIKSKYIITEGKRIDGKFFLNNDALLSLKMKENENKCSPLSKFALVFNPPVFKRQFCQNTPNAVQYFQSSDVPAASEQSSVFINKKQAEKVNAIVKENQILVTGFGTIGNVRLVSKLQEGVAYANNTCRIEVNHNFNYGFIYAFMASKYGKAQLNNNGSGSVVRYIEAPGIKRTLIPIFPEDKQLEIHNLIVESAELRVEANKLQREAIYLIENTLPLIGKTKQYVSSISNLSKNNLRFNASTNFTNIELFYNKLTAKYNMPTIEELSEKVFTPNIFKRLRVDNPVFGIPFLSGSDLLDAMPTFNSFLSKRMKNIDDYILRNGWIAIQDAGTIGYVTLVNGYLDGVAATNNLVRIVPKKTSANYYIYAFLKTQQGQAILKSYEYGSVQKHIDNNQVSQIKIPILPEYEVITSKMSEYLRKTTEACNKENQAIQLVENEIEQWQH
jgi:type I restriction enzyme, S subunit